MAFSSLLPIFCKNIIMSRKLTKSYQREIISDFIYGKDLEVCMFVYLDILIDTHKKNRPNIVEEWGKKEVLAALETSYSYIRKVAIDAGMLTEEAAGDYLLGL